MNKIIAVGLLASVISIVGAHADDWGGVPVSSNVLNGVILNGPNAGQPTGQSGALAVTAPLQTGASIVITCPNNCPISGGPVLPAGNGINYQVTGLQYATLSLSNFARSDTVSNLATQVSALSDMVKSQITGINNEIAALDKGLRNQSSDLSAMAATLHGMAPLDGKDNRLGMDFATVNGRQAAAINYTRVVNQMDLNAGVAWASNNAMAHMGIGVSW